MLHLPTVKDNLGLYIDAGFPILYICTFEEAKVDRYIAAAAGNMGVLEWNGATGFRELASKSSQPKWSLEHTLSTLSEGKELDRKLLVIKDAVEQLKVPKVTALLKEIARRIHSRTLEAAIIIVSPTICIPQELEKLVTVLELELPDEEEISGIVNQFIQDFGVPPVPSKFLDELSIALKGLSEMEIEDLLRLAVSKEEGELTSKALQLIFDQKQQIILKAGILEMVPLKESISDIGGLEVLKEWLQTKAVVFKNMKAAEKFGVTMPKGVLIAGLPGCGKSLSAKAAGKLFDVPLLRLDMGRLMGKYVGESEENMRKAIRLAEAISPCVLWVDELEKAFAGAKSSGGGAEVTTRLFGAFLTWMQEKQSAAFVVATANEIKGIPPELLRKGRFDEIFYVGLPDKEERRKIFEIHLKKRRRRDVRKIDIDSLVSETEGYSGADIEGVVNESVESAFVKGCDSLTTAELLERIHTTNPLSVIMKEKIDEMTEFYKEKKFKKASR